MTTSETLNVNGAVVAFSTDRAKVGWTVGGGVEAALWGNWTGKLEYLYIDFGTVNDALIGIAPITPVASRGRRPRSHEKIANIAIRASSRARLATTAEQRKNCVSESRQNREGQR